MSEARSWGIETVGDTSACWFVVVPDCMISPELVWRLRSHARHVVSYPSGRPWLLGCWPEDQLVLAAAGWTLLATAGTCSLSAAELTARVKGVGSPVDVETALRGAHGSFHVIASVGGRCYVRGSASGARRVYRTKIEGVTICADRARTLGWLVGAELDTAALAARLAFPGLPHPVAGGTMWRRVHAVEPAQALQLEPDGSHRTATWWQPPPAELSLAEGAAVLRGALGDAVAVRVRPGEVLGADLSGGMDSTSVCFLAAQAGARLVTATLHWSDPGNKDHAYAQHAAEHLPGIERLVFASAELPGCFTGLAQRHDPTDEPSAVLRDRAIQQHLAQAMQARGALRRLCGHGGDHLVFAPHRLSARPAAPSTVVGATAHRRLAGPASLADRGHHTDAARCPLLPPLAGRNQPPLARLHGTRRAPQGWGKHPQLPPWVSEHTAELLAEQLRAAAERAEPLATDRGRHAWVHQVQEAGRIAGILAHSSTAERAARGQPVLRRRRAHRLPRGRPDQARNPWSYKPLLAVAMDELVPARILDRTTKDHCGPEWHAGLRAHRRDLADWADESHLVTAGLADETELRRGLLSPGMVGGGVGPVENTLGLEGWLRDLAAHPTPSYLARPHLAQPQGAPR
jgi:asparagine synthase (glutamine-hydrolysing)